MDGLPRRDRKYIGLVSLGGLVLCAVAGLWTAAHWLLVGCLFPPAAYWLNARIWKIPFFPYDRILSARSADGRTWTREPGIRLDVDGLSASVQVYYPVVARMQKLWRMYYRAGGNNSSVASAVSADGLTWRAEAGWRIASAGESSRLEPHCALEDAGGWYLYFSAYDGKHWSVSRARSSDGLEWDVEGRCRGLGKEQVDAKDAWVLPAGAGERIYFRRCENGAEAAIYTGESVDGLQWSGVRRCTGYEVSGFDHVASPRVVGDAGNWRMYFCEWADESFIGARIASATSQDGVHWEREEGMRLEAGGRYDPHGVFCPEVVPCEMGWRMYYGGFWEKHWLQPLTLYRRRALRRSGSEGGS